MLGSWTDGFWSPSRSVSSLSITRRPAGISAPVYVFQSWISSFFILPFQSLVAKCVAVRHFRAIGFVNRLAKFAAVDFSLLADEGFNFFRVVVPALQMAAAKFVFRVLFIARALRGFFRFDFRSHGRFRLGGNGGRGWRSSSGRGGGRRRRWRFC